MTAGAQTENPRLTATIWLQVALLAIFFGPIWDIVLSLPISPASSGVLADQWKPGNLWFAAIWAGYFSAGNLVAAFAVLPWIRRVRKPMQFIGPAIATMFILAAVFTALLLMPQDVEDPLHFYWIFIYSTPTALLSLHVALPTAFAQLWIQHRLVTRGAIAPTA
jgi:hypothetical protein